MKRRPVQVAGADQWPRNSNYTVGLLPPLSGCTLFFPYCGLATETNYSRPPHNCLVDHQRIISTIWLDCRHVLATISEQFLNPLL